MSDRETESIYYIPLVSNIPISIIMRSKNEAKCKIVCDTHRIFSLGTAYPAYLCIIYLEYLNT